MGATGRFPWKPKLTAASNRKTASLQVCEACTYTPYSNPPETYLQSDILTFLKSWAAKPLQVAAIAPSGRALADLMTRDIGTLTGPVIELGPGTGVFTRALVARGVALQDLTLIEYGSAFTDLLGSRFPGARVIQMDAARLKGVSFDELQMVGAVVSGLPLLSMPPRKVMAILAGSFWHLRIGGAFYQFTYGPRCPVSRPILDRLGLKASFVGKTMQNVPPAAVYRIVRRAPLSALLPAATPG